MNRKYLEMSRVTRVKLALILRASDYLRFPELM